MVKVIDRSFIVAEFLKSYQCLRIHSGGSSTPTNMVGLSLLAYRKSNTATKTGKINFTKTPEITSFKRPARLIILFLKLAHSGASLSTFAVLEVSFVSLLLLASNFPSAAKLIFFSGASACCLTLCCSGGCAWGVAVCGFDSSCNGWRIWSMPPLYFAVMLLVLQFGGIWNSLWKRCHALLL